MNLAIAILIVISIYTAWKVRKMTAATEELQAQVENMGTVVDSAIELINGIADKIDEAIAADDAADDGELASLSESLRSDADRLASAVSASAEADTPVDDGTTDTPVDDGTVDDTTGDTPVDDGGEPA